jgi:SAM-dependent methyltransferase
VYRHPLYGPVVPEHVWAPAPSYLLRRQRLLGMLEQCPPGPLLEVGCGAGTLICELSELGFQCEGLEMSAAALAIASDINAGRASIHHEEQTGWQDNFDYLLAMEVLEHIEDDSNALMRWRSWLKPDGRLLISVPAHEKKWTASDEWAGHYRRYERDHLVALLERCGFRILHIENYGFPLANMLMGVRARQHAKDKVMLEESHPKELLSQQSGIARKTVSSLFPLLESLPGTLAMKFFFMLQSLFAGYDLGPGYLVQACRDDRNSQ